ncbi:uracil-DNA glycosylase [Virgibacillus sediminis]|uniref:Uracil-DNA glycosylase n=1 Tax=Virgibacillus sediminis TaxID=202260 RepID=A0ABV7A555_9BACI
MSDFCPSIWPEEPAPGTERNCNDCGLAEHGTRIIWGEGNPQAPIMVLLDNPGAREDRSGSPFVCGTRHTLQETVDSVGLEMDDLYVTYVLKRKPTRAYDKPRTRVICMRHLDQQLEKHKPDYIVCLGNVAAQSFFEDEEVQVKTLRGECHEVRGIKTTAAYHPLAVRRRPNLLRLFKEDWQYVADQFFRSRST